MAAVLDDLKAGAVELPLMQPRIASRNGLGGRVDAGTDELDGAGHGTVLRLLSIRSQRRYVEIGVEDDPTIRESECAIGVIRRCRGHPRAPTVHGSPEPVGVLAKESAHLIFKM